MQVLITCGRRAHGNANTFKTFVFNTADGSYTQKANLYWANGGIAGMGCAIKPWDQNMILCAGGIMPGVYRR